MPLKQGIGIFSLEEALMLSSRRCGSLYKGEPLAQKATSSSGGCQEGGQRSYGETNDVAVFQTFKEVEVALRNVGGLQAGGHRH